MIRTGVCGLFVLMLAGAMMAAVPTFAQSPSSAEPAATNESLPWLAPPETPAKAEKKPVKTTTKTPVKCEEQDEDGCRTASNCAWVAHIQQTDGSYAPARCAEKKVPGAPAKPKTTASKPKPKPEEKSAAQAGASSAAEQTAKPGTLATTPASPEAKSESGAPPPTVIERSTAIEPTGDSKASGATSDAQPAVQAVVKVPTEIAPPASGSNAVSPAVVEPVQPQQP